GGDVEGVRAVTTRAAGVDQRIGRGARHWQRVSSHRLGEAGDLLLGLAAHPERRDQRADLRAARLAGHDRVHCRGRLFARQRPAVDDFLDRRSDAHRSPPSIAPTAPTTLVAPPTAETAAGVTFRKLASRSLPASVRIDSGWNWTPSTG